MLSAPSQQFVGPPKPISEMEGHATALREDANRLGAINDRLSSVLDRLTGPVPTPDSPSAAGDLPSGVLYVAQFERRRITARLDDLTTLVERLDNLV